MAIYRRIAMGTPTDWYHLGVNALMRPRPDIVVSGINAGPNLGDDVIYSGTVAAARWKVAISAFRH